MAIIKKGLVAVLALALYSSYTRSATVFKKDEWFLQTKENENLLQVTSKQGVPLFRTKSVSFEEAKAMGLIDANGNPAKKAVKVYSEETVKGIDITGDEDPELAQKLKELDENTETGEDGAKPPTDPAKVVTV